MSQSKLNTQIIRKFTNQIISLDIKKLR